MNNEDYWETAITATDELYERIKFGTFSRSDLDMCIANVKLSCDLLRSCRDLERRMSEQGRKGGSVKSAKKTEACRANARKPRPNARKGAK
jgi:hypothetical protein